MREREEREWGYFNVLDTDQFGYKVKKLVLYPGKSTSIQYHHHREEFWVVVYGEGLLSIDNTGQYKVDREISPGAYVAVAKKAIHQVRNTSKKENLIILELQLGDKCEEDDIVRLAEFPNIFHEDGVVEE